MQNTSHVKEMTFRASFHLFRVLWSLWLAADFPAGKPHQLCVTYVRKKKSDVFFLNFLYNLVIAAIHL